MKKVLIAARGETALRILRACKDLGLHTVVAHSIADAGAMPTRLADESVCIGPAQATKSYLDASAILSAAELTSADAIHPGIGFLSENSEFAAMAEDHGLTFIGPSSSILSRMGHKGSAKSYASSLGLKVLESMYVSSSNIEHARQSAKSIGYPVLLKALHGGGGKGIHRIDAEDQLESMLFLAEKEARACFLNGDLYMEKYLRKPRHIEVQILGDGHHCVCLGDRDCSIQRRHQKLWEEASSSISHEQRCELYAVCSKAVEAMEYRGLGTLEFLYDGTDFYFMEMNTRLQVEHPITEIVTGYDLVCEQINVFLGSRSCAHLKPPKGEIVRTSWHAIECRINAEDAQTFQPSPGEIAQYLPPGGPWVRVDSHAYQGYKIPSYYDSLLGKLIVYGPNRQWALRRLRRALSEYVIDGVSTLLPLFMDLSRHPDVENNKVHVQWLEEEFLPQKSLK